ncbi:MAG: response regulator transcription factor [Gracilimonas sp.]|jgi:DNA-binding NarL/FixJ family response regulator|nr:response regulator transcription factor [Gracilimonas sp.]
MDIKIGIVEDQRNIREKLVKRFNFFEGIKVVLVAENGEKAIELLDKSSAEESPDILLMDIELPGMSGIDATAHVKASFPNIDIMMQTVFEDQDRIFKSIQAGASGYLLKDESIEHYVAAIREMANGGAPINPAVASKILSQVRQANPNSQYTEEDLTHKFSITEREIDILHGIVKDLTDHQIADEYSISPHTVRTHIKNIYKKLHVHSRASAVKIALQHGLIS